MTITEFLLARLAEREALALAATVGPWAVESQMSNPPRPVAVWGNDRRTIVVASGAQPDILHIAANDPADTLRMVAAHRAIVELHSGDAEWCGASQGGDGTHGNMAFYGQEPMPMDCETLRALAAGHADHPDYQQEWAL